MPRWRGLLARWPHSVLQASEDAVGLPRRPDGQLRGRPPQPRRRPAGAPGPAADRRGDRGRLVRRAAGAARRLRAGPRDRAACTRSAWSGRAASTPTTATSLALVRLAAAHGRPVGARPRAARRPRHAAELGAGLRPRPGGGARGRAPGRADRDGRRALLGDGPRPALGADRARLRRDRPRGGGARAERRRGDRGRLRPGRDRRVRRADGHRRRRRGAPRPRPDRPRQLPRRPRPPADPRARRPGVRRLRPDRPRRPSRRRATSSS